MHVCVSDLYSLSGIIDCIYEEIKDSISNENVKFARIEKSDKQWLLSIVLVDDFTEADINEIVMDTNIDIAKDVFCVHTDLSYGNGFILGEKSIVIPRNTVWTKEQIKAHICTNSYQRKDIEEAINMLVYGKT